MTQVYQEHFLSTGKMSEILEYFENDNEAEKQKEVITGLKKSKAGGNIALGIFMAVLAGLATIYGVADVFGGAALPMGVIFLIGGPIIGFFGIVVIAKGFSGLATASEWEYAKSIEELCKQFYHAAFCKAGTDAESREDYLIDNAQLIPAPVWGSYRDDGWKFIEGKPKKMVGASEAVECKDCHKRHEHSEATYISVPINDSDENADYKRESTYLQCSHCDHSICYTCAADVSPKELQFICPTCGKARNGKNGLSNRWDICRQNTECQDQDYQIASISIEREPNGDNKIVNIVVGLSGSPYGSIKFKNTAINIGGNWFLASPEPLLV